MSESTQHFAKLDWLEDGLPKSTQFDDIYFSVDSGLEETQHVFLKNNALPERFSTLENHQCFTIGETGFGTGLNFLAAWALFDQIAPKSARLHFVSTELYPLNHQDLSRALAIWPCLEPFAQALLNQYRVISTGWQTFHFDHGRVTLTLLIGDALDTLPKLAGTVDAWFLDGFAPSKNPEMWQDKLFECMAEKSKLGTTLATFTAAGFVRRGLASAGFSVKKVRGYGRKRDMTVGEMLQPLNRPWQAPWLAYPKLSIPSERTALIIGAGIAGASTAYALAQRGWKVQVLDQYAQAAQGASGNQQGLIYPRISPHLTEASWLHIFGYSYSLRLLNNTLSAEHWATCGIQVLAENSAEAAKLIKFDEIPWAKNILSTLYHQTQTSNQPIGLSFSDGTWVSPSHWVNSLLNHPNIQFIPNTKVLELNQTESGWIALCADHAEYQASIAIVANAHEANSLLAGQNHPITPVRGQISLLPANHQSTAQIQHAFCKDGYLIPAHEQSHVIGATYHPNDTGCDLRKADHLANLAQLQQNQPKLAKCLNLPAIDIDKLQGRASIRAASQDHLPLVGPVADQQMLAQQFKALGSHPKRPIDLPMPYLKGLFLNVGFGSTGLCVAPLCGEYLAALINQEILPLDMSLVHAISPNRFTIRKIKKNQI